MNILCISKYASPPKYGIGAKLYYIAQEFIKLGNEVTLISSNANHLSEYPKSKNIINYEKIGKLNHTWIKTKSYTKSSSFSRLISWLDFDRKLKRLKFDKKNIPDVVIVSSLALTTIRYGIKLKKRFHCKLVFEIRDIYPLTLTAEMGFQKRHPLVLWFSRLEKKGYKNADLIVGTMPNLKEHVYKTINEKKLVVHSPIGIPEQWDLPKHKSKITKLFPKDKFIVGYAGSMGKSNALEPLIDAIKIMNDMNLNIHFVLVGDGEEKPRIIEETKGLQNITVGPKIKKEEVPLFLEKCDILYFSTHKSEVTKYGQSYNKLVDYMMAGKVVLASYSGYESMINEAGSGMFIPAGSIHDIVKSIIYYYSLDKSELKIIGLRGREWIKDNMTYGKIAQSLFSEIKKIKENN